MKCPKCATEVQIEAVYCPACGARLDEVADARPMSDSNAEGKQNFNQRVEVSRAKSDTAEQDLWQGGFSPRAMVGTWILYGVISIVALIASFFLMPVLTPVVWLVTIPALALLWAYQGVRFAVRRLGLHYRLTNQRFFHESGIFSRTTNRIEVIDMDDITFVQGFVDRFFGVGTIKVSSTDITHPVLMITGIDDVQKVAGLIDNARRAERLRRGLHIETV
ncbi:MAG: PH domain-containing protein [Planctomycetia bacterium]|nr:PH domain-containing protein [Planctomycetia bacterium]